jgi:spermidine/putrescine-binding protein
MLTSLMRAVLILLFPLCLEAKEALRVLTWEGYIQGEDIRNIDQLLADQGYPYYVDVVQPYAEGAEQMFDLIRGQDCDISFLTLFFINMEQEKTAKLLQPINVDSPRLTNYDKLLPGLTQLSMGLDSQGYPLYIPWGGGAYGFYADHKQLPLGKIPRSVTELWSEQWRGKFSLNKTQAGYNFGLALMSLGKSPFHLFQLVQQGKRQEIKELIDPQGELQTQLNALYQNAGHLWASTPEFKPGLSIVSSWGPEVRAKNQAGGKWEMIRFSEGEMVWLDTINFVKHLRGPKLEAAEVLANYFISKDVQDRIAHDLSMVPAMSAANINSVLGRSQQLYKTDLFVPPYDKASYRLMKRMTLVAEQSRVQSMEDNTVSRE